MTVSKRMLDTAVRNLNTLTGNPTEYSHRTESGAFVAHIGHYHVEHVYHGFRLVQTVNDGGATHNVNDALGTREIVWNVIQAFMAGWQARDKPYLPGTPHKHVGIGHCKICGHHGADCVGQEG